MSKAKMEAKHLPKRFYAAANMVPHDSGFFIALDGKNVKTPMGKLLHCKSQQLAQQIAQEWEAQTEAINADTMPLTRLLTITLDRVPLDRSALLADIANYCETDLLFYREPLAADSEASRELRLLQQTQFTPILDWCSNSIGAVFVVTDGVMPIAQPPQALRALAEAFAAADDHALAALAMMTPLLGSALLSLAVWKGTVGVEQALVAARLDEAVQAKYWGEDGEGTAKWQSKCRDIRASAFFLTAK
jgi:chaperone required for assembly of F1-ATPase